MNGLAFDHPAWLLLLWLLVPLALLAWHAQRRRRAAALSFAEAPMAARLLPPRAPGRLFWRSAFALLAFASLAVAAAGPRFGVYFETVKERGADLMVLLDVSRSMLSQDVVPSRLERAKSDVRDLVARVVGHRLGLVAFAGKAVVACPLTTDRAFFKSVLDQLGPESAPRGGTAIGDALRVGLSALPPLHDRDQAMLLITDGEDQDSFPMEAAAAAAERGVKIFTVGLGDPKEGARVPVEGKDGAKTFLKHDGQEVWSKMDEKLLTDLATKTGGAYVPARTTVYDLGEVYTKHLANLAAGEIREERRKRLFPQFQLFLGVGLGLLLLELLVPPPRRRAAAAAAALLALLSAAAPAARADEPAADVRAGIALLKDGKADEALKRFDAAAAAAPDDPRIVFDRALAKEAKQDFDGARADYLVAAVAPDARLARSAQFNLGALAVKRARLALGEKPVDAEPEKRKEAEEQIGEAIRHFRTCIDADAKDHEARQRLESLIVWLKEMRELWAKRDREKQRDSMNALQFLEWLFGEEQAIRDAALALDAETDTPLRRAAVSALADRQRQLKEEIPPLQKKLTDLVQQMAQGAGPGGATPGAAPAPNAPDPKKLQETGAALVQAAEQSGAAMAKAAELLDGGRFEDADAKGHEAQQPLDELWFALASAEATLARGLKIGPDVVARSEPFTKSDPKPDPAAQQYETRRLPESDERLAQSGEVLGRKAKLQLDRMEKEPPPAAAPPPAPLPPPAPTPPPPAGGNPPGPTPAPPAPAVDPEALKKALTRAVEVGPQVAELARGAAAAIAAPDWKKALDDEQQALALLQELDKIWPKPPQDQNDRKKDDQKKNDPNRKDDQKKNQDQKNQDKKDQDKQDQQKKDQQKKDQGGQPQKPGEMTPQQVQALLAKAVEHAKEKEKEKKEAEASVLVPVKVDRDW